MRNTLFMALVVALLGVAGCANQVPVAENFSLSTQKKLRAPHHWDVIAEDVVAQTRQAIQNNEAIQGRALYVQPNVPASSFEHAFRNFMITSMVNHNIPVSDRPEGSVVVQYATQLVHHNIDRKYSPLLSGVVVARNIQQLSGHSGDVGPTWSYLTDGPTDSELIVTTSIVEDGEYAMRKSDVYYVDGVDLGLFLPPSKPFTKDLKAVGQ
ncbi:MAG: hypothetical protein EOM03_17445 [Clostridia bacterium]|nr:hypothetical protein [Clostridia bacterium]